MPEHERRQVVAQEWVLKAENDLRNATHTLKLGAACPTDTVCFHAQQCAEKYLKALLVTHGIDFPKTHDLEDLIGLLPASVRLSLSTAEQEQLTDYATGARYPGWGDISLTDARHAVAVARRIRKEVRRLLPKAALRRRKP